MSPAEEDAQYFHHCYLKLKLENLKWKSLLRHKFSILNENQNCQNFNGHPNTNVSVERQHELYEGNQLVETMLPKSQQVLAEWNRIMYISLDRSLAQKWSHW